MSGLTTQLRNRLLSASCAVLALALLVALVRSELRGETRIDGPTDRDPITVSADFAHEWAESGTRVSILRGHCRVVQGDAVMTAQKAVLWRKDDADGRTQLAVFLEGDVRVERPGRTMSRPSLYVDLVTRGTLSLQFRHRFAGDTSIEDALFQRALLRKNALKRGLLRPTQLVVPQPAESGPALPSLQVPAAAPTSFRRIQLFPRSAVPFNIRSFQSDATTPPEQIWVLTGGVNLIIDGVEEFGTVDLSADNMVIWTQTADADGFGTGSVTIQSHDTPLQVYMEGNIIIRQGLNVANVSRAFYDAREDRGLWLNAELRAFIPELQGDLRIRAERIRQLSRTSFHAQNAWATTSQFGWPGYRLQASDIFLDHRYTTPWTGFGAAPVDPVTGAPIVEAVPWVTSLNNAFFIDDVPLLFTPYLSAPAEEPSIPLNSVTFEQDGIFGTQIRTNWDLFKILGIDAPPGVEWDLQAEYLSERGPAVGTSTLYQGRGLFGLPGLYRGEGLAYYIYDDGNDNLGMDRRNLQPEDRNRGRVQLRHRQNLPYGMTLLGEIGFLSDRNFLEQYYENEFDRGKDVETLLSLNQKIGDWSWNALVRPQVNDFENTTEWLPRGDFYLLSEPLLGGLLTYSTHSYAGYAQLRQAEPPTDPADVFSPLPYIVNAEGGVFMSRHELNLPLSLGPVQVVPYAMGESAYWNDDFNGDSIDRYVGNAGIRSSILFWRVLPYINSRILNLNGLAHKMVFDADFSWTDASENLDNIPQYNEFDENAQERFRQRFLTNTFGGILPAPFDPRRYAVRTGAGRPVTAPWHELVDDQQVLRLGWRHRLQTKVGPPDRLRIKDWMTLDLEASYFPKPDRDNFGEDFGLLTARYRWDVGARTSFLADAHYDLFDNAQQIWNVAVLSQRSTRGSVYFGLRQIEGGPLESQILTASYSYAMSPKWISTMGTAYDLAEDRNRGQSLTITRVGADFLFHVGASFDESKDNAGIAVSVEPRFGRFDASSTQLGSLLNTQ